MARHPPAARTALLALTAAVAACGPVTKDGKAQVMALSLSSKGAYETRQVELTGLADVVALKGDAATLLGGARVVIDANDPLLQTNNGNLTDKQLEDVFMKSRGTEPRASYIDKQGVLWPADFHTWNMVTTYFNFQKAYDYWRGVYTGAGQSDTSQLKGSTVLYFVSFTLAEASPNPQNDNALFYPPIQAFAVLPFDKLQAVPLSINGSVIAHEYSHRVFNQRVFGGKAWPEPFVRWVGLGAPSSGINLLKSMDEGLADFHAYGASCVSEGGCNPRFLAGTLDDATAADRDLSRADACMTLALGTALTNQAATDFMRQSLEYRVGTALAASLYQAGNKTGKMAVIEQSVLNAYDDPGAKSGFAQLIEQNLDTPESFRLHKVANAILAHIPDNDLRKVTCNEFLDRLQLQNECLTPGACADILPDCPASSSPGSACSPTQ